MARTKTLRFDDEVLQVLRGMEWSADGLQGKLTAGQLERSLYVRVDKALKAMSGRWVGGKTQAHIFDQDPREQVEGLVDSGSLTIEKDGFFETPEAVTLRMLDLMPFKKDMTILEPSAGLGAIARVLQDKGAQLQNLKLIEKNPNRVERLRKQLFYAECADFLEYKVRGWQRIYMNPPFEDGQDIEHVYHAFDLLNIGGGMVSVMGEGAFFSEYKRAGAFREWMAEVGMRSCKLPEDSFKESGTGVNTRLVWVTKRAANMVEILQPGLF